jgi:dihydroorotate dehydrogenase (fumarate)/dihydropyrimidine dehydrogenase (NAD+) subunit PreA
MAPFLGTKFCGKEFKNPIVVASATPSKNAEYMRRCVESGAGGIVTKTISPEPLLRKYVSPRFTVLHKKGWPHIYSNYSCEFLATYTVDEWLKELRRTRGYCDEGNVVLIGSLSGDTMQSWSELARQVEDTGVDMLELNLGCPHPRDLGYKSGQELGSDPDGAAAVTEVVVKSVKVPVVIKLTPEAVSPVLVARRVKEAGASAVTAINRFPALEIDLDTGRPLLHSTYAGVSGPWMRPITLKWIARIAKEVGIPISATNGIRTWKDIIKCIMVGASTVQTCSALMYGTKQFKQIQDFLKGMERYMAAKGYGSLEEIKDVTLPQISTWDVVDRETRAISRVDAARCTGCKLCPNWCFYDAITIYAENGKRKAAIDPAKCDGCGLCAALCPKDAITMEGPKPVYMGDFD